MDSRIGFGKLFPEKQTQSNSRGIPQTNGVVFRNLFERTLNTRTLNVSGHAEKRLNERNIALDIGTKNTLIGALDELAAKGARDSLVLTPNAAFLLNVPTRTLVTAMDLSEMKNRIVTQIDSVFVRNG